MLFLIVVTLSLKKTPRLQIEKKRRKESWNSGGAKFTQAPSKVVVAESVFICVDSRRHAALSLFTYLSVLYLRYIYSTLYYNIFLQLRSILVRPEPWIPF